MKKNALRTSRHIISFYQLNVKYDDETVLPVVVDSSQTIEYLRALVEAVYAFNFTLFATQSDKLENTLTLNKPSPFVKLPIVVALLCNEEFEPLNFESKIEDILHHGDTIVIGACEMFSLKEAVSHEGLKLEFTVPADQKCIDTSADLVVEKEFYSFLRNRKLLSTFKDFCLSKTLIQDLLFWIDVEVFHTSEAFMPTMGKYIFATYLTEKAPLKINIPNEIKQEVIRLAAGTCPIHAFDEAQLFIFNTLKCIVFPRFKETPEYSASLSKDISEHQITLSFSNYFPSDDSLLEELTEQHEKYSETEMPMYLKEIYLNRVINRYFPEALPTLDYFEIIQVVDQQNRTLKLQREKKLRKFFGVTTPHSPTGELSPLHNVQADVALKLQRPWNGSSDIIMESASSDLDNGKLAPRIFQKKKRIEKLESFFGVKPETLHAPPESPTSPEKLSGLVKTNSLPILVNQNEIPSELKQRLTRRSRKIRQVLGDGVEPDLNAMILENTNTAPLPRRHTTPNAHDLDSDADSFESRDMCAPPPESRSKSSDERLDKLDTFLADTIENETTTKGTEDDATRPLDTREAKLKRRGKLQHLLGQGQLPPDSTVITTSPTSARSPSLIQTQRTRRIRRRQSMKIEKILGEVPSNYKLSDVERKVLAHQHFMDTISMMLQRKDGISRIMNYLVLEQRVDPAPAPVPIAISPLAVSEDASSEHSTKDFGTRSQLSTMSSDLDSPSQLEKLRRQKKFNKLSKFFGGAVDPELLIEQKILSELERKIEADLHADDASVRVLKENLQSLREQVKSAVDDLSDDDLGLSPLDTEPEVGPLGPEFPTMQP